MDENIRYNLKRVKNNVDNARNQMIKALNILKTDINVNGTPLENDKINTLTYHMRNVSNDLSILIKFSK